jgi:hypothetical protein
MKASHKEQIIGMLIAVVSLVFWLSISTFLPQISWHFTPVVWSAVVAGFLLAVLWGLAVLLVENILVLIVAWAISSYVGVLWFQSPIFIGAASLLFLFGIIGYYRTRYSIQSTLGGGLLRPLRKAVPILITFLLIAVASAYYIVSARAEVKIENILPEKYFIKTLEYSSPVIKQFEPTFQLDATVEDFIINKVKEEMPHPTPEQEAFAVSETLKKIKIDFGISVKASDPYAKLLYHTGIREVERYADSYKKYFPAAYAVALFFTLRFLAFPLYWLAMGVSILLLRIFHKFGIIEMRAIPATILAYSFS